MQRNMRVHVVESVVEILELVGEHKRPFHAMLERRAARRCVLLHQVGAGDGAIRQRSIASQRQVLGGFELPADEGDNRFPALGMKSARVRGLTAATTFAVSPCQHPRSRQFNQEIIHHA